MIEAGTPVPPSPQPLDRSELRRLILQRVEAVRVAEDDLHRHEDQEEERASACIMSAPLGARPPARSV